MPQGKPLIDVLFPKQHGGRRKGAGRKPSDPSGKKKPCTVWLSPAEVAHCRRLGGAGVRLRQLLAADMQAGHL